MHTPARDIKDQGGGGREKNCNFDFQVGKVGDWLERSHKETKSNAKLGNDAVLISLMRQLSAYNFRCNFLFLKPADRNSKFKTFSPFFYFFFLFVLNGILWKIKMLVEFFCLRYIVI